MVRLQCRATGVSVKGCGAWAARPYSPVLAQGRVFGVGGGAVRIPAIRNEISKPGKI